MKFELISRNLEHIQLIMPNAQNFDFVWADSPFADGEGDVVLISSDTVRFSAFKNILSLASPVFADMFMIGQTSESTDSRGTRHDLSAISVTEHSRTLDAFLRWVYPVEKLPLAGLTDVADLLEVGRKYEAVVVMERATTALHTYLSTAPLHVFAIACRLDIEAEARIAAQRAVVMQDLPMFCYLPEMGHISAGAYFRLLWHTKKKLQSVSDDFWDTFAFTYRNLADGVPMNPLRPKEPHLPDDMLPTNVILSNWAISVPVHSHRADIIVRSSDAVEFPSHILVLSLMSPVLAEQVKNVIPSASGVNSKPVLDVPEPSHILYHLLRSCYGFPLTSTQNDYYPQTYVRRIHAVQKYKMTTVIQRTRREIQPLLNSDPLTWYFLAVAVGWDDEARDTARASATHLDLDIANTYVPEMEHVSAKSYYNLLKYEAAVRSAINTIVGKYSERTLGSDWYPDCNFYDDSSRTRTMTNKVYRNTDRISSPIIKREIDYVQVNKKLWSLPHVPNLVEESRKMEAEIEAAVSEVCLHLPL